MSTKTSSSAPTLGIFGRTKAGKTVYLATVADLLMGGQSRWRLFPLDKRTTDWLQAAKQKLGQGTELGHTGSVAELRFEAWRPVHRLMRQRFCYRVRLELHDLPGEFTSGALGHSSNVLATQQEKAETLSRLQRCEGVLFLISPVELLASQGARAEFETYFVNLISESQRASDGSSRSVGRLRTPTAVVFTKKDQVPFDLSDPTKFLADRLGMVKALLADYCDGYEAFSVSCFDKPEPVGAERDRYVGKLRADGVERPIEWLLDRIVARRRRRNIRIVVATLTAILLIFLALWHDVLLARGPMALPESTVAEVRAKIDAIDRCESEQWFRRLFALIAPSESQRIRLRDREDELRFEAARAAGQSELERFVAANPTSRRRSEVERLLKELAEEAERHGYEASVAEGAVGLQSWLRSHPKSPWRSRAEQEISRLRVLEEENAFAAALRDGREAIETFLRAYPETPHRAEAEREVLRLVEEAERSSLADLERAVGGGSPQGDRVGWRTRAHSLASSARSPETRARAAAIEVELDRATREEGAFRGVVGHATLQRNDVAGVLSVARQFLQNQEYRQLDFRETVRKLVREYESLEFTHPLCSFRIVRPNPDWRPEADPDPRWLARFRCGDVGEGGVIFLGGCDSDAAANAILGELTGASPRDGPLTWTLGASDRVLQRGTSTGLVRAILAGRHRFVAYALAAPVRREDVDPLVRSFAFLPREVQLRIAGASLNRAVLYNPGDGWGVGPRTTPSPPPNTFVVVEQGRRVIKGSRVEEQFAVVGTSDPAAGYDPRWDLTLKFEWQFGDTLRIRLVQRGGRGESNRQLDEWVLPGKVMPGIYAQSLAIEAEPNILAPVEFTRGGQ